MSKIYVLKACEFLNEHLKPCNKDNISSAIDELCYLIQVDQMNSMEDFYKFRREWAIRMKDK